jgi:hypothetical protein
MRKSSFIVILSVTTYILGAPLGYPAPPPAKDNHTTETQCTIPESPFPNKEASAHPVIIPRGLEGTVLHLNPDGKDGPDRKTLKTVTVGPFLARGCWGEVHHVSSHHLGAGKGKLVAKRIHTTLLGTDQESQSNHHNLVCDPNVELANLRQVQMLHASGKQNGHLWAIMDEVPGQVLKKTKTWKDAPPEKRPEVYRAAKALSGETQLHHAVTHKLMHNDLTLNNVKYEENEHDQLTKAHFVDWGFAKNAPPPNGPDGKYDKEQEAEIRKNLRAFPSNAKGVVGGWAQSLPNPRANSQSSGMKTADRSRLANWVKHDDLYKGRTAIEPLNLDTKASGEGVLGRRDTTQRLIGATEHL